VDHRDAFVESLDDEMLVDVDVLISSDGNFDFTQSTDWRTVLSGVPIHEVNKKRDGTVVRLLLLDNEREKLRLAKEIGEISIRSPLRPTRTQPVNKALTQHSMTEQNAFTRRTAAHGHDEEACHKLVQNATAGTSSPNH
jgi:hypothetical protein